MSTPATRLSLSIAALAALAAGEAKADLIVLSNPDAPLPTTAGNGLAGDYYQYTGPGSPATIANANAFIAGRKTDATLVTTGINYPAGFAYGTFATASDSSTTVGAYLGSDANSLVATANSPSGKTTAQILGSPLNNTIYTFTGYLAITQAQTNVAQTFYLGSDDGSALYIQGQQAIANDGDHGTTYVSGNNTYDFTKAGLYAVTVLYYEDNGGTDVSFGSTLAGSGTYGGELTSASLYQTAPTPFAVPEPSTFALAGLGLAAAVVMKRKRARA